MKIKKQHINYCILIALLIFAILPWIKEGIPATDDYRHHAMRLWFEKEQFSQMHFSEWMPYIYGGWPVLHFYHPMFYILSLPFILFSAPIAALKVMTVVAYIIALFGTFYAGKILFKDDDVAMIAAIAYFLSSHFLFHATVSGALPRLTALALTPLTAALFIKAIEENSKKYTLISAMLLAVLLMMHTSVAVPVFIICLIYYLFSLCQNKNINLIKSFAGIIILFAIVAGLCASWVIPMLLEKNYANLGENEGLGAPSLKQSLRTFGIVPEGNDYLRSNYFGYISFAFALFSLFFIKKNKTINLLKAGLIASLICYFNLFDFLKYIPLISTALTGSTGYFAGILVFNIAMLAGIGIKSIAKKINNKYFVYLAVFLIIIELYPALNAFSYGWIDQPTENFVNPPQLIEAWNFIKNQEGNFGVLSLIGQASEIYHQKQEFGFDWVGCPQCVPKDIFLLHNDLWRNFTKGMKNDELFGYLGVKYYVLPCQYQMNNKLVFTNNAICVYENEKFRSFIESDAQISSIKQELDKVSFTTSSNNPAKVLVKINYFKPHWHAYANGNELQIQKAWPDFMLIEVPAGINSIELKYKTNLLHIFAWIVTLFTAFTAIWWVKK